MDIPHLTAAKIVFQKKYFNANCMIRGSFDDVT